MKVIKFRMWWIGHFKFQRENIWEISGEKCEEARGKGDCMTWR